jgi:iron complex outermembrane receptor protein
MIQNTNYVLAFRKFVGAAALAVIGPASLAAQVLAVQNPAALKSMTVDELLRQKVISVSRRPETLGQVPSSVFLIRGEAAQGTGANRLPELLRLAPNLFVAQSSSYDWAVGARGFTRANSRVNKMQVLIDGRVVYSPLFSGVFWGSQDVFLPDLDRIEVISGPAGVTWGANAVNGVINITTKSARETQGSLTYGGVGNELIYTAGIRYGGRLAPETYYRVYAKSQKFDDTLAANGSDPGMDEWDFTQAGFRMDGGDETSETSWTLQGDGYRGNYDGPGLAGGSSLTEGANVIARWARQFSNESSLILRGFHDYTRRDEPGIFGETLRTTEFELQHRFSLGARHDLVWGANYRFLNESVDNWEGFWE